MFFDIFPQWPKTSFLASPLEDQTGQFPEKPLFDLIAHPTLSRRLDWRPSEYWSYVIPQLDNSNHLSGRQTRKSLQTFCCTTLKCIVPSQKKAQKCFGIAFLLPTCVASFCASIYYIPWLTGSLLAGTLPFGISTLSETFREWKGIIFSAILQ